jgi:hypothetical protein
MLGKLFIVMYNSIVEVLVEVMVSTESSGFEDSSTESA